MSDRKDLAVGAIGAAVAWLWGTVPMVVWILLAVQIVDYISGVLAAGITGQLSSSTGWKGVAKKALTWCVVAVAFLAEQIVVSQVGNLPIGQVVAGAYVAVEAMSVLENTGQAGNWVPGILRRIFTELRDVADSAPPSETATGDR